MNLSCSSKVIKYLMLIFNFIFLITGIIILSVGVSVKAYYYQYDTFLDDKYFSLPNLLIATGAFIFIISFFGCYGALKQNWILLVIFSVLLIIIFIFEFSAGIAGYVLRDKTSAYLDTKLRESLDKYLVNQEYTYMWDFIQTEFECCGVQNATDWNKTLNSTDLPISCCPRINGTVGVFYCNSNIVSPSTTIRVTTPSTTEASPITNATDATPSTTIPAPNGTVVETLHRSIRNTFLSQNQSQITTSTPFSTGCEEAFGYFVKKHAVQIGGVAMALAVIQILGIAFSCHLARQLKNGYYST